MVGRNAMRSVALTEKRARRNDVCSVILFYIAAYLMLGSEISQTSYLLLGLAFLIAGIYGTIAVHKGKKFIF